MASIKKILPSGTIEWHNEAGRLHREDGPALERVNGAKTWYLNGKYHREDGPACEWSDGIKEWWLNGERHRVDGPAVDRPNGTKFWFLNGKRHREDGPAVEHASGIKEWYLNDVGVSEQEHAWRVKHGCTGPIDNMPEKLKMEYLLVFG